jgi:hypothetical protein
VLASSPLRLTTSIFFQLSTCGHSPYVSLTIAAGTCQRSHSRVRVPRDSWPNSTFSDSRLPQPGGPGPRIYIPQEQYGPVIPPGTGFPFRRLLRLAGLRWRYSNPSARGFELRVKSQSYFTTGGLPPISSSWRQALWDHDQQFVFQRNTCGRSSYVTSSLTRGWVCCLQLLLAFASGVILRSESHGTHDNILLFQIRDSPNLEGHVPVFISPRNRVAQLYPQALDSLFVAPYNSQGYDGGIRPRLHTGFRLRPTNSPSARTNRKHCFSQFLYCCAWTVGVLTWSLLSQSIDALAAA